ncbi:MAG: ABC transporter ATP-binding protein, partial [Deltaproteobacteria bacterium]|nr:ABC transporter ATP-binding protein [Deltaproteobacteria bacterium]
MKLKGLHRVYRTFVPHLRKHRRRFVLTYLALFAAMLMNVLKPWPLKIILDYIILDKAMPHRLAFVDSVAGHDKTVLLAILCAGMVAIFILEGLFTFIRKYFMEAAGERAINDIRKEV